MSKSVTPNLRKFARRLLSYELENGKSADAKDSAAFHVCEKLRGPLGKFLGLGGFRALLFRAQALASKEVPWLHAIEIKPDGSLEGLDELEGKFKASVVAEGEIILVAELLGLLITFIGAHLTLRLVQEIWPELDDLIF